MSGYLPRRRRVWPGSQSSAHEACTADCLVCGLASPQSPQAGQPAVHLRFVKALDGNKEGGISA